MHRPPEELLQYIWQHRLLQPADLYTVSGQPLHIAHPGTLNRDAGPDFFNATVAIGGVVLSGNVEVHVRTSDWSRHGHETDRSYDRIILHVVYEHDAPVQQNTDHGVDVFELRNVVPPEVIDRYAKLVAAPRALPCAGQLHRVPEFVFGSWLERLAVERMEQKQARIARLIHEFHGDHAQVLYTLTLSAFGFNVNAVPFELLARQLPFRLLLRHADHLPSLEALLAGTAGLLDEQLEDPHLLQLQNIFAFLRVKYGLHSIRPSLLKFSRMRPANFPTLRLAQFAAVVYHNRNLFNDPSAETSYAGLMAMLRRDVSPFWLHHYSTRGKAVGAALKLGVQAAESILINVFAPFLFYYGKKFMKEQVCEQAFGLLNACRAENNHKTRLFAGAQCQAGSAVQSQAMIVLHDQYCARKQCLRCAVGVHIVNGDKGRRELPIHSRADFSNFGS